MFWHAEDSIFPVSQILDDACHKPAWARKLPPQTGHKALFPDDGKETSDNIVNTPASIFCRDRQVQKIGPSQALLYNLEGKSFHNGH
jgi:hypothetical protein